MKVRKKLKPYYWWGIFTLISIPVMIALFYIMGAFMFTSEEINPYILAVGIIIPILLIAGIFWNFIAFLVVFLYYIADYLIHSTDEI